MVTVRAKQVNVRLKRQKREKEEEEEEKQDHKTGYSAI